MAHVQQNNTRRTGAFMDQSISYVQQTMVPSHDTVRQQLTQFTRAVDGGYILPWTEDKATGTVGYVSTNALNDAATMFSGGVSTMYRTQPQVSNVMLHGERRVTMPLPPSQQHQQQSPHATNHQQYALIDPDMGTCNGESHHSKCSGSHSVLFPKSKTDASSVTPSANANNPTLWQLRHSHSQTTAAGVIPPRGRDASAAAIASSSAARISLAHRRD